MTRVVSIADYDARTLRERAIMREIHRIVDREEQLATDYARERQRLRDREDELRAELEHLQGAWVPESVP